MVGATGKRNVSSGPGVKIQASLNKTLEDYKAKTDALFSQIDSATGTRTDGQRKQIAQAHAFYEAYAYPDAYRTAAAVLGGK
jgi:hypothetical protein